MPSPQVIVQCESCRRFSYAPIRNKTKKCPFCGKKNNVDPRPGWVVNSPSSAMRKVKSLNLGLKKRS